MRTQRGVPEGGRPPQAGSPRARTAHGIAQIAAGLAVFGLYLGVTHGLRPARSASDARGHALLDAERWLHLDLERATDHWLAHVPVLGFLAAWEYALTYILTTFLVLGWVWWRRPHEYAWARNTLVWATLIAIACFALWPTTPPRLLRGAGFVDIVARHHPLLSWGSGTVSAGADQYAAMPSLHVGWAVWVTVVTLRARATRLGYGLAILHLIVTTLVVIATGNHYILDVLAGGALVGLAVLLEFGRVRLIGRQLPGERVAAPDEFFLHVEVPTDPQPVGGFVLIDVTGRPPPDVAAFRALVAARIGGMPRFQQALRPATAFRHTRWVPAEADLEHHVREHRLPPGGGRAALAEFVSRLSEQHLDRSRPMWQLWVVPEVGAGEACIIAIVHHAVADGLGVIDILRQLLEPELAPPDVSQFRLPSRMARAGAVVAGTAQLASDGAADQLPILRPLSGVRRYRMASVALQPVRELARRTGTSVTDVLLAAVGDAVSAALHTGGTDVAGRELRAAVPVTIRLPAPAGTGWRAAAGNYTAALRLDVPLDVMSPLDRLHATAAAARPRRRSGRAAATEAIMRMTGALPPALQARVARAMYTGRFLGAIVSNMPGPSVPMSIGGYPIKDTYPILPLADRVPLGVGTLGWAGRFCISVLTDTAALPDADLLLDRTIAALQQMAAAAAADTDRTVADRSATQQTLSSRT